MHDKPKMLTGLNQNGTWLAALPFSTEHADIMTTDVQAGSNPPFVMYAQHGKPDVPPIAASRLQGRPMVQRVQECGESERRSVMERIRIATSSGAKASRLP